MHANLSTADGVYGILSGSDVSQEIRALGNGQDANRADTIDELVAQTRRLLAKLERGDTRR